MPSTTTDEPECAGEFYCPVHGEGYHDDPDWEDWDWDGNDL